MGVDVSTLGRWELSQVRPKVYLVPRIAEFLGYSPYEPAKTFPEVLRTYRRAAGLSRKRLAKLAGLDAGTVGKWERGESRLTRSTLRRLQQFFRRLGMELPDPEPEMFYPRRWPATPHRGP